MVAAVMPYTSTGPAIMNILAPKPVTRPSLLNSMAGEATALAKPVMGTSVPAPACLAMLSYTLKPVRMMLSSTRDTEQSSRASLISCLLYTSELNELKLERKKYRKDP